MPLSSEGIFNIDNTISRQIGSLTGQVRDILEEQNSVTAGKDYEILEVDLEAGTVTFSLTAAPRKYWEELTAAFSTVGPDFAAVKVFGESGAGEAYPWK